VSPATDLETKMPTAASIAAEAYDARRAHDAGSEAQEEDVADGTPIDDEGEPVLHAETAQAEASHAEPADETASVTTALEDETSEAGEAVEHEAEEDAPVPELAAAGEAPELDFDGTAAGPTGPGLDVELPVAEVDDEGRQALQWDADAPTEKPTKGSSSAPLGERAAAALCDLLVLTAIAAALVGAAASGTGLPFRQVLAQNAFWLAVTWAIFATGYSVFLVGSCGQTIGRMVMRLRVVGDEQFSVGFDRAAIRLAAWVVSALPLFAGMIPALKDPQLRALHDRLSRTRVVKA
jgi:uncharacterized RDD family membrane protein YckC